MFFYQSSERRSWRLPYCERFLLQNIDHVTEELEIVSGGRVWPVWILLLVLQNRTSFTQRQPTTLTFDHKYQKSTVFHIVTASPACSNRDGEQIIFRRKAQMESWLKSGEASISHTKLTTDQRPYQWLTGVDQGFLFFQSLFWASWKWNTWCYNLPVCFSIKESPTSYPSANCRPGISLHFLKLHPSVDQTGCSEHLTTLL